MVLIQVRLDIGTHDHSDLGKQLFKSCNGKKRKRNKKKREMTKRKRF